MPTSDSRVYHDGIIGYSLTGIPTIRCHSTKRRKRLWGNTANYASVPRSELPINTYVDEQMYIRQPTMVHYTAVNTTDGSTISRVHDGRFYDGLESLVAEYAGYLNPKLPAQSSQDDETLLKALVKLSDMKANLPVAMAEAKKTSDLILSTANRVYKAYSSLRKGNFRAVARHLNLPPKTVHNTWLEYKYGWMPLLLEVKGSAEFLAQQHLGGRPPRFTVRASTDSNGTYAASGALEGWHSLKRSGSLSRKVKVMIECEVINPRFNQSQQLGLTNPLLVAWELVPFSFVFDWFISVGDYLQGITALHGIKIRKAMRSREKVMTFTRTGHMNGSVSGSTRYSSYDSVIVGTYRAYERDPIIVDPLSLRPTVNFGLDSLSRVTSALALLRANSRRFG